MKGKDSIAVVTGASHGLGAAIAEHLAGLDMDLVLIARGKDRLDATAAAIQAKGGRAWAVPCDVADPEAVQAAAAQIVAAKGRVDVLVNNAGIPAPRTFEDTDFESWAKVIATNLSGAFYLTRALWDALIGGEGGYVINISGTAGLRGGGSPAYGGSKFGLIGLTRAIAAAGVAHNVRATVLYPGGMDTGWRGAPIGVKPPRETMDPHEVAGYVGYLIGTPEAFVVNEAILNPIANPWA